MVVCTYLMVSISAACHGGLFLVLSNTKVHRVFELAAVVGCSCKGAKDFAKQGNTLCNSNSLTSTTTYHNHNQFFCIVWVFLPLSLALGCKCLWPSDSVSGLPHQPHRECASKTSR